MNGWLNRPRSRETGIGTVFGTALLVSFLAIADAAAQPAASGPYDAASLLEIRPAGGNVVGPGADLMPQTILKLIQDVPHVVRVEGYLFVGLRNGTKQDAFAVIGGTVPGATFRVNCHNVDAVKIIDGRGLEAEDAGKMAAIIGRRYAETYASPGQGRIPLGAAIDLFGPATDLGGLRAARDAKVSVVGIFSAGFPLGDNQVLLPLAAAQKLFGLEGKISKVFVTLDEPGAREKVTEALFALLGQDVDVVSPLQGGMRGMPEKQ